MTLPESPTAMKLPLRATERLCQHQAELLEGVIVETSKQEPKQAEVIRRLCDPLST